MFPVYTVRNSKLRRILFMRLLLTFFFQTDLCIYEIDDPSQRNDQDETAQLLKRIAELEDVIREVRVTTSEMIWNLFLS